jgi:hypothetical protein
MRVTVSGCHGRRNRIVGWCFPGELEASYGAGERDE